jgi:hypothetical protein
VVSCASYPNHPDTRDAYEYRTEGAQIRLDHQMPEDAPLLFFEVYVRDASEFTDRMVVRGIDVEGHRVLRADAVAIPNAIAAFLIYLRDERGSGRTRTSTGRRGIRPSTW